jgi:hypothetical protein
MSGRLSGQDASDDRRVMQDEAPRRRESQYVESSCLKRGCRPTILPSQASRLS